jgi:2-hydroxy-5-methyl-1-naphthoate 7-hydroxylase
MKTQCPAAGPPFVIDTTATDIHAEADRMRAIGPAVLVELPGGVSAWSVTDPDLIRRLLTDRRISKNAQQHWPGYAAIPDDWPLRIWVDTRSAMSAYGHEHTRLRRLIGTAFTARRVRAMAPAIEEMTNHLLDQLGAVVDAEAPVDLRAQFLWILPLMVVNTLLGVPQSMHDAFRSSIDRVFSTNVAGEQAHANRQAVFQNLADLVTVRSQNPGDDVTSALIAAYDEETDSGLSQQELLGSLLLLIGAGHVTTVNLLDHAVVNLLDNPGQLALVLDGHATWADAVEETLRHQAPIASIMLRFAIEDVHDPDTGLTFHPGEPIVVNYAAAGRDPQVHGPTAAQFDVTRSTRREHLAFGHGTHYCLGAELARLEARIALPALFARFPDLTLAVSSDALRPLPSFVSNGHQQLPVILGADASVASADWSDRRSAAGVPLAGTADCEVRARIRSSS